MATKACDILEFNIKYNEKNDKKELILGLINYSNSYIKDRFKYIGDNLGELEKKQVIILKIN